MIRYAKPRATPRPTLTLVAPPSTFVREIAVVGPGIIGMPMAALLSNAELWAADGTPTRVTVVQRASQRSGWKVGAINAGRSPLAGVEPALDELVAQGAGSGRLRATTDYHDIRDAELILVCVQTDRVALRPDDSALRDALRGVTGALARRQAESVPLVVIESTLAPSSMLTVVRDTFAEQGLEEGRDVLLAYSPNRLMLGKIVEQAATSHKVIGTLTPDTAPRVVSVYRRILRDGTLLCTNSMTAEVVKTLENASRDVHLAYAAEVVRFCDAHDVDFFAVRGRVNARLAQEAGTSSAESGLLVPTVGVGGYGLPKDGVLLWWRALERGVNPARSLMLEARRINDESPSQVVALIERFSGSVSRRSVALLGVAYRADSSEARHSPTLALARHLLDRGAAVSLHDPLVGANDSNLMDAGLAGRFHRDMADALASAEVVVVCVAHREYLTRGVRWLPHAQRLRTVIDGCNAYRASEMATTAVRYTGIGRGFRKPSGALIDTVVAGLQTVRQGLANEAAMLCEHLNAHHAAHDRDRIDFGEVRRLASTSTAGCAIVAPGIVPAARSYDGFRSRLIACATAASPSS